MSELGAAAESRKGWPAAVARHLPAVVCYAAIFAVSYFIFSHQLKDAEPSLDSDLPTHLQFMRSTMARMVHFSHPGFHLLVMAVSNVSGLGRPMAAVWTLAVFQMLMAACIWRILLTGTRGEFPSAITMLVTLSVMLAMAIYLPLEGLYPYRGQWSPNPWHSPTQIASRPFMVLLAHLVPAMLAGGLGRRGWLGVLSASVLLLVGTFIKPTFTLVFIPALGLYVLLRHRSRSNAYLKAFLAVLPTLVVLGLQYVQTYQTGIDETGIRPGIGVRFLAGWRQHSSCVPFSILLAWAFPLALLIARPRRVLASNHLSFAWICLIVATLQGTLLMEGGRSLPDANFFWGYMLSLQLVFIYTAVEAMKWFKEGGLTRWAKVGFSVVAMMLVLHLASGILYLVRYYQTSSFL
jgi:hypothetical protein